VISFSSVGCFFDDDDDDAKANVRFTNSTGSVVSNISGGGSTWSGPYSSGTTTEQKPVSTGNVYVTWTCGGSPYSMYVNVESGNWRLVMFNCNATGTATIKE
jgi:hypothetical protein